MLVAAPAALKGRQPLALDDDALPAEAPFRTSISRGPFSVGTWIVPPSIARVAADPRRGDQVLAVALEALVGTDSRTST